jgi:hypothetical protein
MWSIEQLLNEHPSVVDAVSYAINSYGGGPKQSEHSDIETYEESRDSWRSRVGRNVGFVKLNSKTKIRNSSDSKVKLTIDYGYDIHSIIVPFTVLEQIAAGKKTIITGQGFPVEGELENDEWAFNTLEANDVHITTDSTREILSGDINNITIEWVITK